MKQDLQEALLGVRLRGLQYVMPSYNAQTAVSDPMVDVKSVRLDPIEKSVTGAHTKNG